MEEINFNRPFCGKEELANVADLLGRHSISGDGKFTKMCNKFFSDRFGFSHNLLTTSATDALEMAAILLEIKPGDEVIVPSYTFSSTPNAFILRGAKVIFADSHSLQPNIDEGQIERLITNKTKAIVPVHYAGVACNMEVIMSLADKYGLGVVEDAAQALDSRFNGKMLGSIGDFGVFSFHETKNITCGEGGLLVTKDERFYRRGEIIREKGTNRSSFFRGEINKYGWVDMGSSFLPSDILAAILYAQLEKIEFIQDCRVRIWKRYYEELSFVREYGFGLPVVPA